MRKNLGPKSIIYPEPVLIIGTYDEKKVPNAMNAAWGGVSDVNEIHLCLSYEHKTVKNLLKTKEFTVSFATRKYEKECDYVGMVSGNDEPNKLKKCGFHTTKAKKVNAPLIKELPLTLECKLIKYDKKTGHLYASIENVSVDDSILTDGKVDMKKFEPIIYDGLNHNYHVIGKKVGEAYKDYLKIK